MAKARDDAFDTPEETEADREARRVYERETAALRSRLAPLLPAAASAAETPPAPPPAPAPPPPDPGRYKTRADLFGHIGFMGQGIQIDTLGQPICYEWAYQCEACDHAWRAEWSSPEVVSCPRCHTPGQTPVTSRWIGPKDPAIFDLYVSLPGQIAQREETAPAPQDGAELLRAAIFGPEPTTFLEKADMARAPVEPGSPLAVLQAAIEGALEHHAQVLGRGPEGEVEINDLVGSVAMMALKWAQKGGDEAVQVRAAPAWAWKIMDSYLDPDNNPGGITETTLWPGLTEIALAGAAMGFCTQFIDKNPPKTLTRAQARQIAADVFGDGDGED